MPVSRVANGGGEALTWVPRQTGLPDLGDQRADPRQLGLPDGAGELRLERDQAGELGPVFSERRVEPRDFRFQ
jgi:hypothetical protein